MKKHTRARAGQTYAWLDGHTLVSHPCILILEILEDAGELEVIPMCIYISERGVERGHIGMWGAAEL